MPSDVLITPASSKIDFTDGSNSTKRLNISGTAFNFNSNLNVLSSTSLGSAFKAEGVNGTLFEVIDDLSNSLMSVNTIGGLPVFEVFANNSVIAGQYGANDFVISANKVGIGTSSPAYKLDVRGITATARVGLLELGTWPFDPTYIYLQNNSLSSNSANYVLLQSPAGETFLNAASGQVLHFRTGNNERWIITAAGILQSSGAQTIQTDTGALTLATAAGNGNIYLLPNGTGRVGLGTNSPTHFLDVRGNIRLGADNSGNYIYYVTNAENTIINTSRTDASQQGLLRSDGWGNFTVDKSIGIGYSLGSSFSSSTIGNGNLYVLNTIGVNTTSPLTKLDVRSGSITSGTASSTSGSTIIAGYYTAGALTVLGTEQSSGGPVLGYAVTPSTSGTGAFLSATSIAIPRSAYTQDGGTHRWYIGASQTVAIGSAVTASEVMRINSSGNLGIGTTSPAAKLDIAGTNTTLALSFGITVPNNPLFINTYGGYSGIGMDSATAGIRLAGDYSGGTNPLVDIGYYTSGSVSHANWISRLKIINNGNVGIGAVTPNAKVESYFSSNALTFNYLATNFNNNSPIPTYSFDVTGGAETRSIKAGIGYERHLTNGRGAIHFYNDSANDTSSISGSRSSIGDIKMTIQNDGNVGIGVVLPSYKLDVNGTTRFGGIVYNEAVQIDDFNYFNLQPYIESETLSSILSISGTAPTFTTLTNTTAPFSKVLSVSAYGEAAMSELIPVQAGETIYGEIWAYRATGAAGTAGVIYCGVQRFDKDKKMIDANAGLNTAPSGYFIASNQTIPSNSTWTKYSGTLVLPTSHTPYNTSDGGPVRYIRPYIIYNYTGGTILTYIGGWKIRKVQLTRDSGPVAINGSVAIGSNSVNYGRLQISATTTSPSLSATNPTDPSLIISNSDVAYGTMFATYGDGKGALQQRRTDTATYYDFSLQPHGGNVGIGTASAAAKLEVYGVVRITESASGSILQMQAGTSALDFASTFYGGAYRPFTFTNGGSERLRIQSDGNVGIGTTAPVGLLNIRASSPTGTGTVPTGTNILIDSNTSNYLTFRNTVDNGTYAGLIFLDNNIGGYVVFGNSGASAGSDSMIYGTFQDHIFQNGYVNETLYNRTETMRIKQNGNVGIGNASPNNKLHVNGSISIGSGYNTAGPTNGLIVQGNVGIGSTNPIAPLDIFKSSAINGPMLSIRADFTSVGKFAMIRFGDQSQTTNYQKGAFIYEGVAGSARGRMHIALENTDTSASVALTDARLTVQSDGNVGIGTTIPLAQLHINEIISGAAALRIDGTNGTLFSIVDDLSDSLMSVNNSAGLPVLEVFADDRVVMGQYGQNDLVVRNNKVGIGTVNPGTSLEIYATPATSTTLRQMLIINTDFGSASGTGFGGSIVFRGRTAGNLLRDNAQISAYNEDAGDNGYALGFFTRPSDGGGLQQRMTIARGGNVGIGTNSPGALLQIGTGTPTAATGGIQFGGDTGTRLYRSASGIITCSGTIAATFSGNLTGNATNVTGVVALANGGSGQTSAQAAMNAFAGAVTSGSYLRGNGTNVVMSTIQAADVPTLNQSTTGNAATASLATTSDRLTSRDNRTISSNEDDAFRLRFGFTSWANNDSSPYADYLHLRSYSDATGGNDNLVMFRKDAIGMRIYQAGFGTSVAYSSFKDVAFTDQSFFIGTTSVAINRASAALTLNGVNISGTAANVTGTVAIANGGTGATTAQLAINALAGAVTNAQYLRGNGTNVVMSAIQASDVPTLNQNTTGSSGSCTGNAATATNASQLGGAVAARYVRNDTDGTAGDLFSLVTVTKSLTVTTSWIDTGISAGSDLVSGAYILTLNVDNYAVSGGHYNETYTGIMYWYAGATNSTNYDEIPLHKSGHAPNGIYINLRTLRGVSGVLKLQIISSVATSGASNYIFKFRRMI
jgi:hypothetical protein